MWAVTSEKIFCSANEVYPKLFVYATISSQIMALKGSSRSFHEDIVKTRGRSRKIEANGGTQTEPENDKEYSGWIVEILCYCGKKKRQSCGDSWEPNEICFKIHKEKIHRRTEIHLNVVYDNMHGGRRSIRQSFRSQFAEMRLFVS